uniref:C2H2-type domain-containing protein n=1 Tax=Anopheles dirus TaxID=7168 RepID=A0A9I3EI99_9DIPT
MTRIRTDSLGLRSKRNPVVYTNVVAGSTAMESSIMDTTDALETGGEMVVVEDVSSSIEHHQHHHHHHHHNHQGVATVPLMNGITVTLANGTAVAVGDNKYDVADKAGIDFASATNHNNTEPQPTTTTTVVKPPAPPSVDDKMQCYASNQDDDNEASSMMMVDSVGATGTAHCNSSHSSASNTSTSSTSSSSSSSSTSSSSTVGSAASHPEEDDVEGDEEDVEEEEEEDDETNRAGDDHGASSAVVDETTSVDKLHMMQTDDDPLLQETINAIMNGADGIEVVNTTDHDPIDAHTEIAAVVTAEMVHTSTPRPATTDEVETDRNYECTYCGKLFTRSNTLSYHLKVHTGERPFKCKHCAKAFREQYRLMKHLKTHSKYRNRRLERGCLVEQQAAPAGLRVPLHRGGSAVVAATAAAAAAAAALMAANAPNTGEEDYATGDSERFFKSYELPDASVAMKLEPDISLTEDADETAVEDGPRTTLLTTEVVETMEEHHESVTVADEQLDDPNETSDGIALSGDGNDIRYQIIEERIKSLQREVHLVNQNLNRVESKVDSLTRIISLFIGKFEDETELANQVAQQQQLQQQQQEQHQQQEQEEQEEQHLEETEEQILQTVSEETGAVVPVASLTVVTHQQQQQQQQQSVSPSVQPKTIFLTSTTPTQNASSAAAAQQVHVYASSSSPLAHHHHHHQQQQATLVKETRAGNTHYYQLTEPSSVVHIKADASPSPIPMKVPSPSPTPPSPQTQTHQQQHHHLTLTNGAGGNQLLDTFPEIPELPIRTVSDFLDLNDHCTDNEQFLLQMMIRLHQEIHNSQPFQRNIKRMMEALVTYEVLCQFSWSGKSAINGQYTKYVFGNSLGIIDLLMKTLNLGKSAEEAEANQKPIFAAIQSFIKHSRQNMIRDSRKRRDQSRGVIPLGAGEVIAGMVPDTTTTTTIALHVNGGERLQIKQLRSERHHHHHHHHQQQQQQQPQTELVHPF